MPLPGRFPSAAYAGAQRSTICARCGRAEYSHEPFLFAIPGDLATVESGIAPKSVLFNAPGASQCDVLRESVWSAEVAPACRTEAWISNAPGDGIRFPQFAFLSFEGRSMIPPPPLCA